MGLNQSSLGSSISETASFMAWMQVSHKFLECIIVQIRFGVSTIGIALSRV